MQPQEQDLTSDVVERWRHEAVTAPAQDRLWLNRCEALCNALRHAQAKFTHPIDGERTYLSPHEEQAVIDAVKILVESVPEGGEGRDDLASVLPKLPLLFTDYRALVNISAIAHNAVVWFSGDRKRMFHKLGDLAEALCERDGVTPDIDGASQLQREAVRIRREWGHHVNG